MLTASHIATAHSAAAGHLDGPRGQLFARVRLYWGVPGWNIQRPGQGSEQRPE